MDRRPLLLLDLEATLDRHWFGSEAVLRDAIPALEPPVRPQPRELATRWRADKWSEPERLIDPRVADALLPYHRDGTLVLVTERPVDLRALTERRLAAAGFAGVPLHHVALGEHPAYGKRRIARAVHPAITVEDDLRIAEFLATHGYETLLVDDRYNRGPIRSVNLMRIARAHLAKVLALRLSSDLADLEDNTDPQPALAPA